MKITEQFAPIARITFSFVTLISLAIPMPFFAVPAPAEAESRETADQPATTIVVFSDHSMASALWQGIAASLQVELTSNAPELQSLRQSLQSVAGQANSAAYEIFRGDEMPLGYQVQRAITVFLHGDCSLSSRLGLRQPDWRGQPMRITGTLGWVEIRQGQIQPFVNIDCDLILRLFSTQATFVDFLPQDQRIAAMAHAISRVMLHEWVHIATQNSGHTKHGVTKSAFNVEDLMGSVPQVLALATRQTAPQTGAETTPQTVPAFGFALEPILREERR